MYTTPERSHHSSPAESACLEEDEELQFVADSDPTYSLLSTMMLFPGPNDVIGTPSEVKNHSLVVVLQTRSDEPLPTAMVKKAGGLWGRQGTGGKCLWGGEGGKGRGGGQVWNWGPGHVWKQARTSWPESPARTVAPTNQGCSPGDPGY